MNSLLGQPILVYDIETKTFGAPNPKKDVVRMFGAYSYLKDKYYSVVSKKDMKTLLKHHKYIVGFNHISYDNQVLYHNGFDDIISKSNDKDFYFKGKTDIDLMRIFQDRATQMKIKQGMLGDLLMSFSLDFISKTIGIVDNKTGKIDDFDYSILNKPTWTNEEIKLIKDYLRRDIQVTKKMYEWLENYFGVFKPFLNEYDVETKKYLTSATSVFTYKAICKRLGWKEEYAKKTNGHASYGGGYVAYPAGESFEGDIYCLDYNSLYPHIFIQCNLFSKKLGGWRGGPWKIKGEYDDEKQGQIEKLLIDFYKERLIMKKNGDPKEYSIKIIINTSYGLSGNESFKHLFKENTAGDCTALGREWVKLARRQYRRAGYKVLYTDTDSVYILDPFHDKQKMLKVKDSVIKYIKAHVPFPAETFDMGVDDEITHMWFFKGKNKDASKDDYEDEDDFINKTKGLMKKNYVYLAKVFDKDGNCVDTKVKVKNLGVRKKSTSALTRKIFWDLLVPRIKKEKKIKFREIDIRNYITKLVQEDIKIASVRYRVNAFETYKVPGQLQAQIAQRYGPGIHFLIPNKRIGVGKDKKYCTLEEFRKRNLQIGDIIFDNVWSELDYFIIPTKPLGLSHWI